jgi:hypothetical protein
VTPGNARAVRAASPTVIISVPYLYSSSAIRSVVPKSAHGDSGRYDPSVRAVRRLATAARYRPEVAGVAVLLIARFPGDVAELTRACDRAHAMIMAAGGAGQFGELRHHAVWARLRRLGVRRNQRTAGGSAMTSYLGTRIIQIGGDLAAELLDEERRAELAYLIGCHIGQLKARHQRLTPVFLAISVVDSLKFLKPFLAPYLRATAKSGDQIAAACCGDIRATQGR